MYLPCDHRSVANIDTPGNVNRVPRAAGLRRNRSFITQGNHVPSSHGQIVTSFCTRSEMAKTWWQSWQGSTWTARRHRVRPNLDRLVSFYGMVESYTLQWAVPSLKVRPETRIHGREVRVNTGWPSPHLVQKVSICDTNYRVQGRATTGEASYHSLELYFYLRTT